MKIQKVSSTAFNIIVDGKIYAQAMKSTSKGVSTWSCHGNAISASKFLNKGDLVKEIKQQYSEAI